MISNFSKDESTTACTADCVVSTNIVQSTAYTRCLICKGSQELVNSPIKSNEITMDCWNPASSAAYKTDIGKHILVIAGYYQLLPKPPKFQ